MKRRSIRRSLTEWSRYRGFEPAAHHQLIIDELEEFLWGTSCDVLLLFAPPGSAKSTYISLLLPSYYLANRPQHSILAATHSVEFAQRWGRRVRNDIQAESLVLGIEPSPDNQASDRWSLRSGGEYYGVGAGVGIAGYRADLGVIDDPFGSREDAFSETIRRKRWDWYLDDFSARLKPNAKRVIMHTRWHEEDIAGRVLQQIADGKTRGKAITIPAVAEGDDALGRKAGEYLWDEPGGYNYGSYLRQRQKETSPMMWSALYQQRPAPEEGDYFKDNWLRPYDKAPPLDTLRVYGASDYAVTADGGDYTVHIVVGLDPEGRPWLLDLWRGQTDSAVWIDAWCDLVKQWKPFEWGEEAGQIRSAVGPFIERRARERNVFVYRRQIPSKADKAVRAQSVRGLMATRGLMVPHNAPWFPAFRSELLSFPAGKYDDQVDALSLVGQLLDTALDGMKLEDDEDNPNQNRGRSSVTGY